MLAKEHLGLIGKRLSVRTLIQYAMRFKSMYKEKYDVHLESMAEIHNVKSNSTFISFYLTYKDNSS